MITHNRKVTITIEMFNEANRMVEKYKSPYSFEGYLKNSGILEKTESVMGIVDTDNLSYVVLDVGINS
jgi:hypothetical protein